MKRNGVACKTALDTRPSRPMEESANAMINDERQYREAPNGIACVHGGQDTGMMRAERGRFAPHMPRVLSRSANNGRPDGPGRGLLVSLARYLPTGRSSTERTWSPQPTVDLGGGDWPLGCGPRLPRFFVRPSGRPSAAAGHLLLADARAGPEFVVRWEGVGKVGTLTIQQTNCGGQDKVCSREPAGINGCDAFSACRDICGHFPELTQSRAEGGLLPDPAHPCFELA